ncbi:uncharacterized protein B0H64DRAFT_416732 [Chaetomium fimeti]|uniref:MINDY deubiquitinase domain-containing protein n=1 Tax=Chaetomium fimeti TaxID=1854472 RepID=A0AAE0HJM5_9PEZI|nr:hypothetical protein B0H64DRAFT_416732 [Chaetomium fimeti]
MVIRKPLPESATPDPAVPRNALSPHQAQDEAIWEDGMQQQEARRQTNPNLAPDDVPNTLRPGYADKLSDFGGDDNIWAEGLPALNTGDMSQVPVVQRLGGSHGAEAAPVPSGDSKPETNPFKRKMSFSASGAGQGRPGASSNIPPVPSVPVADFSQLGGDNVWASARPSRQPTPGLESDSPALVSLPSEGGSGVWGEEPNKLPPSAPPVPTIGDGLGNSSAWGDVKAPDNEKGAQPPAVPNKSAAGADDWNLIDMEPNPEPLSRQSTWENFRDEDTAAQTAPAAAPATTPATTPAAAPAAEPNTEVAQQVPPEPSADLPPPQPPRPVDKSETYQIKNISWHDATATNNPRVSPIVVQNANGPCPLVALVNALTLTTPAERTNTALVETLRSREQVSLGLLLDAVFDELMSERRAQLDVPLPDVTELYDFLKGLHTGMNVNPRFVPAPEVVTAFKRTSLTHLHPTERTDMIPGTFERTREMNLYSTFSIPLIHGWLPPKEDAVCAAFSRQAVSYEDTQNLLFREEELDEKLCSPQGLTPEEQQIYQDILTIKSFLNTSATQLTTSGLNVIKTAMKPGSVAILFRNDHFSTLYRHPQTMGLFTLVTDAGYAGHAEVVWESLVDVNGESAEFFSGDFRLVGGIADQPTHSGDTVPDNWMDAVPDDNNNWTTVQPRRGRTQTARQSGAGEPPRSPNNEQEDRDLALALQLQEEEDERARTDQERRRRDHLLSEQFIQQEGGRSNASLAQATTQTVRSLLPPRNGPTQPATTTTTTTGPARMTNRPAEDGLDDAPPSYEQAAKQLPYVPPQGHPSHPGSHPGSTGTSPALRQGQGQAGGSARPQQQQQQYQGSPAMGGGRSPGMGMGGGGGGGMMGSGRGNGYPGGNGGVPPEEKSCVVM